MWYVILLSIGALGVALAIRTLIEHYDPRIAGLPRRQREDAQKRFWVDSLYQRAARFEAGGTEALMAWSDEHMRERQAMAENEARDLDEHLYDNLYEIDQRINEIQSLKRAGCTCRISDGRTRMPSPSCRKHSRVEFPSAPYNKALAERLPPGASGIQEWQLPQFPKESA